MEGFIIGIQKQFKIVVSRLEGSAQQLRGGVRTGSVPAYKSELAEASSY